MCYHFMILVFFKTNFMIGVLSYNFFLKCVWREKLTKELVTEYDLLHKRETQRTRKGCFTLVLVMLNIVYIIIYLLILYINIEDCYIL